MTDTSPEPTENSEDSEGRVLAENPGDSGSPEDSESAEDAARRRFREALDRKRAGNAGADGRRGANDTGKVHGGRGPASSRRSFRRRGGG